MSEVRYPKPAVLGALRGEGAAPPRLAVIEASAGTGKTFTIEHAVVELVLAGTPIEQLLVVTFTERATSELRERVRALLERVAACRETPPGTGAGRDAWVLDDAARARLQAALLAFDQAPISTIHGFCQRTLVENAFLLGRLLHQELEDERSAFSRAFKHCLRRQLATGALESELVAWLGKGRTVDALETLLYSVHGKRAEVRPPLDPRRLQRALDEALAWASDARLGQARAQVADPARRLHGRTRAAILARLDKLEAWADASDEPPTLLELHADERVDSALDYLLKPTPSAALEALGGEAQALVTCLRSLRAAMTTFEAAATQLFLPPVQRRLAEVKLREGVYTFGDMLAVVREALAARDADGAPTPQGALLLRRLRARYRHALIDEFQDTDEVQWGIFRRVFLESPEHGLWVVGDPKQAIYGFRGGDVFTYLRARAELTHAQAARQPLRASYRSTPALIAGLHALYDPQAPAPFFRHPEIPYDDQVRCGVPGRRLVGRDGAPAAPIKVCKLVVPEGQTLSAGRIRERHGRWIAREVRDLLHGGLRYGDAGEEQPIPEHEVFCLTRTHREGLQLAGYLREVGVRHAFYKQGGLLQTDEAADVLRLLRAVERPWSHAERAAAWITPFFGLALDDLPAARTLPGEHPLLRRLLDWQVLAERHDYEALFGRILEDSGLVRRQVFLREGERELTNYLHVFELLLDEVNHARVDLRELIAILGAWTAERRLPRGENGNVQRLESDRGAVQIMTLHTSKGLEATCVFLYGGLTRRKGDDVFLYHEELERAQEQADLDAGLDEQERRRRWGQRQRRRAREQAELADEGVFVYHDRHGRRVVHVGPPDPATLRRVREEQEDEERRLIYVASTRPRARLGLLHLGHGTPTHGKGPSARSFCYPKLGGTQAHVSARLADLEDAGGLPPGVELEQVTPSTDLAPPPAPDLGALERWSPPAALLDPRDPLGERCRALRQSPAHRARFATSYSALKQVLAGQGLAAELPAEAFVEPEPEADPEPAPHAELPAGTQTGLFVHEALERLPLASFLDAAGAVLELAAWQALPAVEEAFARAARHQGVAERHVAPAQALVHEALRVPLALPAEALPEGLRAVGDPRPEVEFCYPWPEASHPRLVLPPGARIAVDRGYVRGFMDLLFRHPASGRAYVLDWKTDRLAAYGPEALQAAVAERYQLQLELYLLALVKLLRIRDAADYAARCGGVVYAFLRGMTQASTPNAGVFARRPSWEEVLGYEQRLVTLGAEGLP